MHIRMLSSSTVTPPMIGVKSWQTEPNVLLCQLLQTGRAGQRRCAQRIQVKIFLGWSIEFFFLQKYRIIYSLGFSQKRRCRQPRNQRISTPRISTPWGSSSTFTSKRQMGKHDLHSALGLQHWSDVYSIVILPDDGTAELGGNNRDEQIGALATNFQLFKRKYEADEETKFQRFKEQTKRMKLIHTAVSRGLSWKVTTAHPEKGQLLAGYWQRLPKEQLG